MKIWKSLRTAGYELKNSIRPHVTREDNPSVPPVSTYCIVTATGLEVFVYKLSASGFEPSCSHLNFRFRACFEQGVP